LIDITVSASIICNKNSISY